ncbi:hypothetical protein HF086_016820 [Spodoptera exigua]|uniref:Uncharacterized protein n=1 Tax=Spodoptera exigua TaxID=7107 RepID=A0A922M6W1_SPOEX|nr:hypothetical protein HF086_016820 [Spodoptera exigua]
MAQGRGYTTLVELLDENGETQQYEAILERVKIFAHWDLRVGTRWEVINASKEEIFEEKPEPNVLNKPVFALPTVGLVRAFDPEAEHLSEKEYREIRFKLLDWVFNRALILGPPLKANRIRLSGPHRAFQAIGG